jgi:hypothetical protein
VHGAEILVLKAKRSLKFFPFFAPITKLLIALQAYKTRESTAYGII